MVHPAGESDSNALWLEFDRRLKLKFHGSRITFNAGLLAYREVDDALGLSAMAEGMLADARSGRNGRHALVGLLRQSVLGDWRDTRTSTTPSVCAMIRRCRWIGGGKAAQGSAASASQMGRFETRWLTAAKNLSALADLSGQCGSITSTAT